MTEKEEQHKLIESELREYHSAAGVIKELEFKLQELKKKYEDAYTPPNMAVNPSLARVQKSEIASQVERQVERLQEHNWKRKIQEIEEQLNEKYDVRARILLWIRCGNLTGREEQYIRLRYLENNPAKKLPDLMHYEERELRNIRVAALDKLWVPYEKYYKKSEA